MSDAYNQKLDEHSFVARLDPLRDVVRRVLTQWQEEGVEREQLSDEFWSTMHELESVLGSVKR
jgi:uncharacterized NAD(P)/FAD-binding protein YdhS